MKAKELEKCVDRFGTDIYRFCLKLCNNLADAEDLYQQTFLKALESDWNLDWENNPKALFFSLTHKLYKSRIRKNARRTAIAPCTNLEDENADNLSAADDVEGTLIKWEETAIIHDQIESLPEKIRLPLTLHYLFEFPIEEIAHIMKLPSGTIKSRLFKGRSIIKKRLEEIKYEGSP